MQLEQPVKEVIARRKSVRTYSREEVPQALREKIAAAAAQAQGPFQKPVRIALAGAALGEAPQKLGTYGLIKDASYFALGILPDTEEASYIDLGFAMESVLLYAASLGLAACWLAGTFSRADFLHAACLQKGESLAAVSPIGFAAARPAVTERLMRAVTHGGVRKKWEELFFTAEDSPLTKEEAGEFADALEAVRLAPSAMNAQPWRVVKDGANFHFYSALKGEAHFIDLGIALSHFTLMLGQKEAAGVLVRQPTDYKDFHYIATWKPI